MTRLLYDPFHAVLWAGVAFLGFLQLTAVLLNLLPIPGLDGYDALEPHLSPETQRAVAPAKQWGFFILLFLLLAANQWFFGLVLWLFEFSGVPPWLAAAGQRADPLLEPMVLALAIYASARIYCTPWAPATTTLPPRPTRRG